MCLRAAGTGSGQHVPTMLAAARALAQEPDRSTAVMRTRAGMIALDLAETSDDPQSRPLREALIATAAGDAYAARDMLVHHQVRQYLTTAQRRGLHNLVRACGLGAGTIPERLHTQMVAAVDFAETTLRRELEQQGSRP
jgi:glucose/arabinose dehydrogenase